MFKKIYLVMPVILFGLISHAQVVQQPTVDGSSVCPSFAFSNEKIKCLEITKGQLYSEKALEICGNLAFASEKLNCLSVTAGQSFSKGSLDVCANEAFASKKIACLKTAGLNKPTQSSNILTKAEAEISKALYLIKMKDIVEAQNVLQNLRYEISQKNK